MAKKRQPRVSRSLPAKAAKAVRAMERARVPWSMSADSYIEEGCGRRPYTKGWNPETDVEVQEAAAWLACSEPHRKHWDRAMQTAVSAGVIEPCFADRRRGWQPQIGGSSTDCFDWKKLPPRLWHVTTHRDSLLRQGLKSRRQRRVTAGTGLGGGSGSTISLTERKGAAGYIKSALQGAIHAARADPGWTVQDLLDRAAQGEGAPMTWNHQLIGSIGKETFRRFSDRGEIYVWAGDKNWKRYATAGALQDHAADPFGPVRAREMPSCTPEEERLGSVESSYPVGYSRRFWCPAGKLGTRRFTYEVYRLWLRERERAGGPLDPYITGTDPDAVAALDPNQVSILKLAACPRARGVKTGDKHEWKIEYNHAVRLESVDGRKPPPTTKPSLLTCPPLLREWSVAPGETPSGEHGYGWWKKRWGRRAKPGEAWPVVCPSGTKPPSSKRRSFLTLKQAKCLKPGELVCDSRHHNSDGTPARWKVNGRPKFWKTRPGEVRVPLKRGLYQYDSLTESEVERKRLFRGGDCGW